ncbi:TasA family protein [Thermococcus atlanticus]
MKRLWLVALGMSVLLFAGGIKVGVSYFSDVARSTGNEISTGEFDIGISRDGSRYYDDYKLFEFSDLKPGDEKTVRFYIKNRGDYPVSLISMRFNITDAEKGELSAAEALVDNTPETGELSGNLVITGFEVKHNGQSTSLDGYVGKTLADLNNTVITIFSGKLTEGDSIEVSITLKLSENAGNECQTDVSRVALSIYAEQ